MKKNVSRKQFIQQMALLSGGTAWGIGSISGKAYAQVPASMASMVAGAEQGKALVIIQLSGGNDGLNTVIPAEDDQYFVKRPDIGIKKEAAIPLKNGMYLNPAMLGIKKLYDQGKVSVLQNIGYANPDRSHFRATDIWNTGSDAKIVWNEGWAGRYLGIKYPQFPINLPNHPMAIQLGSVESLLFSSDLGRFGTVFEDPNLFYQLVNGSTADSDLPPATLAGEELGFLKQIASSSLQYAKVIQDCAAKGKINITYPSSNLARQLQIVSKLISGGIQTPIFLTTIGGFDTHSNQLTQHANLWKTISEAVTAFQADVENMNLGDAVSVVTFSEFGRTVKQNGTLGTDHGTAAPMFVIGKTVKGGLIGENPNLKNVDANGDLKFNYDYRQVYATILRDHLGVDGVKTQQIFNKSFERLPIYKNSPDQLPEFTSMELLTTVPNPVVDMALVQYSVFEKMQIKLAVYDLQGQEIHLIYKGDREIGSYQVSIDLASISSGFYIISMSGANGQRQNRRMIKQ
jgi:uncharacterized protein (DUF1501 family)